MPTIEQATGCPVSGAGARLTPTKRVFKKGDATFSNYLYQGYCVVCHSKTTQVCLMGNYDPMVEDEIFVCNTRQRNTFQMCFH
jgi:threonine dehydrogenase-like Zn-dependent dehydrogenase